MLAITNKLLHGSNMNIDTAKNCTGGMYFSCTPAIIIQTVIHDELHVTLPHPDVCVFTKRKMTLIVGHKQNGGAMHRRVGVGSLGWE